MAIHSRAHIARITIRQYLRAIAERVFLLATGANYANYERHKKSQIHLRHSLDRWRVDGFCVTRRRGFITEVDGWAAPLFGFELRVKAFAVRFADPAKPEAGSVRDCRRQSRRSSLPRS
jgi:hypothetical protein